MKEIEIDSDKSRLDIKFLHEFLSNSYWAKGRTMQEVQTCIDNSLNFGVYHQNKQVGFARVVTDFSQFAYILDLFIHENYRGKGYSKKLIRAMLESEKLKNVKVWRLATTDAHDLYKQFGFTAPTRPDSLMELLT